MNRTFWTAIILCIFCFIGCDKIDSEEIPAMQPGFMVRKVITPETEYLYEYDELNRLSSITFHDGIHRYEFDYSEDGKLTVTGCNYLYVCQYNEAGEMASFFTQYAGVGGGTLEYTHADGYPVKLASGDYVRQEYVWENGNMIRRIVLGVLLREYSYTKILNNWGVPIPAFWYTAPASEDYQYPRLRCRNLPSSMNNEIFSYERNSDGNISKIIINEDKEYVFEIEY